MVTSVLALAVMSPGAVFLPMGDQICGDGRRPGFRQRVRPPQFHGPQPSHFGQI